MLEGLFFFIFTLMKFFCIVFVARVFICSDLRYKETGYCQNEGRCTHFDCARLMVPLPDICCMLQNSLTHRHMYKVITLAVTKPLG